MAPTDVKPSPRLIRAAEAEQTDIARQRAKLQQARTELQRKLTVIDEALGFLDEREMLLTRLAQRPDTAKPCGASVTARSGRDASQGAPPVADDEEASSPAGELLRGPAIRETAVRLLAPRTGIEAMHYRAWYDEMIGAGYGVAGKDPLAVFLTQLSRSPVVRKTTQSGVYELDRDAPVRLRRELSRLQSELRDVAAGSPPTADLGAIRQRRDELMNTIRQSERALEEAERVLSPRAPNGDAARASGS